MIVVDSSTVVAALVDSGPDGRWAEDLLARKVLAAPHLMPAEVANVLRRAAVYGEVSDDVASLAFADLSLLRVQLYPFEPFARRIWELRSNVSAYDAWYVSLAEALDADLVTLDARLSRASGVRCRVLTPPN